MNLAPKWIGDFSSGDLDFLRQFFVTALPLRHSKNRLSKWAKGIWSSPFSFHPGRGRWGLSPVLTRLPSNSIMMIRLTFFNTSPFLFLPTSFPQIRYETLQIRITQRFSIHHQHKRQNQGIILVLIQSTLSRTGVEMCMSKEPRCSWGKPLKKEMDGTDPQSRVGDYSLKKRLSI